MKSINKEKLKLASDREVQETTLLSQIYANARLSAISNWLTFIGIIMIIFIVFGMIGFLNALG